MENVARSPVIDTIEKALSTGPRRKLKGDRRAAVCAICRTGVDGECEILFIHRAEDPRDPWSGHMAFPGGRVDEDDASSLHGAIRETREELGVDLEQNARLIGHLSDVTAVARGRRLGLIIEPFVFELTRAVDLKPNCEVQEAMWIPLTFFLDTKNRSTLEYQYGDALVPLPCYRWREKLVWGLTLRMIDEITSLVHGSTHHDWPEF